MNNAGELRHRALNASNEGKDQVKDRNQNQIYMYISEIQRRFNIMYKCYFVFYYESSLSAYGKKSKTSL